MPYRKPGSGDGCGIRLVGGKPYNMLPSERTIGRKGLWEVVYVPEWSEDGWYCFKMFLDDAKFRKKMWNTSIKDERVSRCNWIMKSMSKHKGMFDWFQNQMIMFERNEKRKAEGGNRNGR